MRNKISFFILSNAVSPVKQLTFSKPFIRFVMVLILAGLSAAGVAAYDYLQLRHQIQDTAALEQKIRRQHGEIVVQRKQIVQFAKEINELKAKLVDLSRFEEKIRIIANIEKSDPQEGLFGVGGPHPKDLDTSISSTEKHHGLLREMHEQTRELEAASVHQEKDFKSLIEYLEGQINLLACTPAIKPTKGWVTCEFGYRKSPFTGLREFHKGIDIANRKGSPIVATADGTVTFVGRKGMLGKVVTVDHGNGMITRYGHAHKILKNNGAKVKRGDTIALVGNSGRTTGSHVHYEVLLNGVPVNPRKYILN